MYKSTLLQNAVLLSPIIEAKGIWIYLPCICIKFIAVLIDYWKWNFAYTTDLSSKVIFPKGTIWRAECAVFLLSYEQHALLMYLCILLINLWITMAHYGKVHWLTAANIFSYLYFPFILSFSISPFWSNKLFFFHNVILSCFSWVSCIENF